MAARYSCPICKEERAHFDLIYKLAREIRLDPHTGEVLFSSDEMETVARNGRPDIDVRCHTCGYIGNEMAFRQAGGRESATTPSRRIPTRR